MIAVKPIVPAVVVPVMKEFAIASTFFVTNAGGAISVHSHTPRIRRRRMEYCRISLASTVAAARETIASISIRIRRISLARTVAAARKTIIRIRRINQRNAWYRTTIAETEINGMIFKDQQNSAGLDCRYRFSV